MSVDWQAAQRGELAVWRSWGDEPVMALRRRAEMLGAYCDLDRVDESLDQRTLLEIGAAGAPVISFLPAAHRVYVDPIFAEIREAFAKQFASSSGTAEFHTRAAEDLSFIEDGTIDLAFCLNVLDHTSEPRTILREIRRKLRPDARLLVSVDCYSAAWLVLRRVRVAVRGQNENDRLHPHHFTRGALVKMIEEAGFDLLRCFLAPGDGLSKSSMYGSTSEYPLRRDVLTRLKQSTRLYALAAMHRAHR